jgi:hypothetical protein
LLDETGCDGATGEELRFHTGNYQKSDNWIYRAKNNISNLHHCITTVIDPAASGNYLFTRNSFDRAGGYLEGHGSDTFSFGFKQYATGSKIAILPNSFYWHFQNAQGYWMREEKTGNNERAALSTLLAFSEVFSSDTIEHLKGLKTRYAYEINAGNLKLTSPEILDCLFAGYKSLSLNEHEKALAAFEKAIAYGCDSEKIKIKIAELKSSMQR